MPDIRINSSKAERTLALILRDECKMLPTDANSMAAKLVERLKHARNSASRPGLRDARIIPQYASDDIRTQSAASTKQQAIFTLAVVSGT